MGAKRDAEPGASVRGRTIAEIATAPRTGGESLLEIAQRGHAVGALRDSSDNLQSRLALAGPDVQRAHAQLVASQRGATRSHTGSSFQADVNATAAYLAMTKLGRLERHHPEFIKVPRTRGGAPEWIPKAGGAPCDYSGHVNAVRIGDTYRLDRDGVRIPVVFDAKVAGLAAAAYTHDRDAVHQLLSLRDAAATRAIAFLLVYVRRIEAAALIGPAHFDALIMGRAVPMLEAMTERQCAIENVLPLAGRRPYLQPGTVLESLAVGNAKEARPVRLLVPAVPYSPGRGWDFAPALAAIDSQLR